MNEFTLTIRVKLHPISGDPESWDIAKRLGIAPGESAELLDVLQTAAPAELVGRAYRFSEPPRVILPQNLDPCLYMQIVRKAVHPWAPIKADLDDIASRHGWSPTGRVSVGGEMRLKSGQFILQSVWYHNELKNRPAATAAASSSV